MDLLFHRRVFPWHPERVPAHRVQNFKTLHPAEPRQNVAHHYDLSDDLFDLFLDEDRQYSCAYFATPMAYVFLAVFLLALGVFTWEAGNFFGAGSADLSTFFVWHPWLYMIFLPALAMRLWADERGAGTDELLLSLPLGMPGLVLGKLCAAWTVAGVGLLARLLFGRREALIATVLAAAYAPFWLNDGVGDGFRNRFRDGRVHP